jgi:2Fe-2S ferredoxin
VQIQLESREFFQVKPKAGIYIKFLPEDQDVPVSHKDVSVLDVALRAGIAIDHTCGGHATCGTCMVNVVEGWEKLGPRDELELEMAADRGFADHERLACQIRPVSGLVVKRGK